MLFNSFVFWIFFALVLALYRILPHTAQNRMLLVASYIFYGYWDYRYLTLIFLSTLVDYFVALKISTTNSQTLKKRYLSLSIATNLGMLGFFKYYNFFTQEASVLLEAMGLNIPLPVLEIVLPVGISFYTFQTMSYTIDVYRGITKPSHNFLDFALYVSFFPQLVAGPIERSSSLLPQILNPRSPRAQDFIEGLYHILIGLFKKVVIADNMAPIVNQVFATPVQDLTGPEVMLGVYAFAFQIYGDFSGYSSIAQGIAKWMGFELSWNFKMPYFSANPSEFWQRWHISLSRWLRDYLYIPLGGNRHGQWLTLRNLVLTMLLGGLWHGAGWTFIVWGLYHGVLLVVYRLFEYGQRNPLFALFSHPKLKLLRIIIFFHLICISWLLFRATSIEQAWEMLRVAVTNTQVTAFAQYGFGMLAVLVIPLLTLELWIERSKDLLKVVNTHWLIRLVIYGYFVMMLLILPPLTQQAFIYFQF